ncbi:hypothetical protein MMC26_005937 [Xylographa opegraphella]|nr:hypothetical protein [Xylographa opegraphella]
MTGDTVPLGALLQKLEASKAIYVANLNAAHDAVVASLKGNQNDDGVEEETSNDSPGRMNPKTKREDILQTERDPLDCEPFYTDHDLQEFLGDLDAQLLYQRLGPKSTGKGFTYVCNGRIMEPVPLKESLLKLLEPLPSLESDVDSGTLRQTRVNNPGWAYKDLVSSFNAVWFTFLHGDHSGSWNLYHDAVSEASPRNFWEMIRRVAPPEEPQAPYARVIVAGALNPDTVLSLLVCLRSHFEMGGICSALFTTASQARILYDHDEQDRHFVRSYFAITYFSSERHDMNFPWHENGPFYESLDSTTVTRCHVVVALTDWEDLDRNTCWTILVVNTTPHTVESSLLRPKSCNGILEYVTHIGDEMDQANLRMSRFSETVWRTVKLPRDFIFNEDARERLFLEDAQLTLARRYFWALQTLSMINESLNSIVETWEKHQSAFETNDRLPYFHRKMTPKETSAVRMATQEIAGTIDSIVKRIAKNEQRRSEIMTLRDGLLSTSQLVEHRIARTETGNMRRLTMASIYSLPLFIAPSILGITDSKLFIQLSRIRLAIAVPVICVSAYLTITALDPTGESFFGQGVRWLRELAGRPKEEHSDHKTTPVLDGEAAAGEGYT